MRKKYRAHASACASVYNTLHLSTRERAGTVRVTRCNTPHHIATHCITYVERAGDCVCKKLKHTASPNERPREDCVWCNTWQHSMREQAGECVITPKPYTLNPKQPVKGKCLVSLETTESLILRPINRFASNTCECCECVCVCERESVCVCVYLCIHMSESCHV